MKVDLTFPALEDGCWRVETEDGVFDYSPDRYRGARRRFVEPSSTWACLSKFIDRSEAGSYFRVVQTRGIVPRVRVGAARGKGRAD